MHAVGTPDFAWPTIPNDHSFGIAPEEAIVSHQAGKCRLMVKRRVPSLLKANKAYPLGNILMGKVNDTGAAYYPLRESPETRASLRMRRRFVGLVRH